ncbi:MAG: hypothetical protein B7Z25_04525 [Aerococcus viridans]|nr:MAG: hypothetical protein B7Z25_04525 [Aerococcus viridans]
MTELNVSLSNVGTNVGSSQQEVTQTAVKHFNKFLLYCRRENNEEPTLADLTTFENITAETVVLVTREIIGKFSDYLMKVMKIKALLACPHSRMSIETITFIRRFLCNNFQCFGSFGFGRFRVCFLGQISRN